MMLSSRIEYILFDYGNVLAWFDNHRFVAGMLPGASCAALEEAWLRLYRGSNLPVAFETGRISIPEFRRGVCDLLGVPLDEDAFDRAFCGIFRRVPEMVELIAWLRSRCRLGLLSNTNALHEQREILTFPGVADMAAVTLSHRVGAMKPDPRIYRAAIDAAGVPPAAILYLDDMPAYVEAGRGAGLQAWQVADPVATARRLRELLA